MQQFRLNGKAHALPTSWADLAARQVLALAPYLVAVPTAPADRLAVLRILCPALTAQVLRRMAPEDVLTLVELTGWLWTAPMGKCPLGSFTRRGVEYLLWEPKFENCVAIEYLMAEHYFRQFAQRKPVAGALEQLVATLCRPRKAGLNERDPLWDGDRRERYNSKIAEARAREMQGVPVATKIVVLQYYVASARAFHAQYQEIYRKPEPGQRPSGGFGLLGILDEVAGEGLYGTFEQTCYTNVHTLFFHLLKAHRDAKAQRRQPEG